ncbi:MAG: glycosyltransferase [Melioribacter sp.]|uniref:glycosyltransferase n=1 Tax=Rosettibacter primus TaxID=3111523 RepID=UPI00247D23FE|nr:glycosyltransferase [Melioribacter sp.]
MKKIVIFGPGPQFKGGIANYTSSLARALSKLEAEVHIVSWTNQYPSIIPRDFIDHSSQKNFLEGTPVKVHYVTNYNNPFSWRNTVRVIKDFNPDIVVFQWAIAIQGLPMGYIAKRLKKCCSCEIIFDLHVVSQKERSIIDSIFLKYALSKPHTFIVHSFKTFEELKEVFPKQKFILYENQIREDYKKISSSGEKQVIKLYHPVYDMFTPNMNVDREKVRQELGLRKYVFLFFGFIRKYKGLHNVIRAFAKLAKERDDVSLLIVGESFWQTLDNKKLSTKIKKSIFGFIKKLLTKETEDESDYRPLDLIDELGIRDKVVVINRYVPNEEVHKYFQVADCNVLFYEVATPSGVESMAYNFKLPTIATAVGHFPETIKHGYNGYLAEPNNVESMYQTMKDFLNNPIPRGRIEEQAKKLSWENYAKAILNE